MDTRQHKGILVGSRDAVKSSGARAPCPIIKIESIGFRPCNTMANKNRIC